MIKIGIKGYVRKGEHAGLYVLVEPVEGVSLTGKEEKSFYVFIGKDNPKKGYDNWYPDMRTLELSIDDWDIEWSDFTTG